MNKIRDFVIACTAAVALIGGCLYVEYIAPPTPFERVCEVVEYEYDVTCDDLSPPTLVLTELTRALNATGLHIEGENIIFVSPTAIEGVEYVVIHETAHYVIEYLGVAKGRCWNEGETRRITSVITNTEIDPQWAVYSGCLPTHLQR